MDAEFRHTHTDLLVDISNKRFNRHFCHDCMRKFKELENCHDQSVGNIKELTPTIEPE